jgi:hypothetical protein
MRRFISFWWMCAKQAFWGNTAFANDWQWMFGIPAATAAGALLARVMGVRELTSGNAIFDVFLAGLVAFIITWLVAFVVRLASAPVTLYYEERDRADRLFVARGEEAVLAEIAGLRSQMVQVRIEIEQDIGLRQYNEANWNEKFAALEGAIASKIEQFSGKAEADLYRNRGNILRPINPVMGAHQNPVLLDVIIHDLDYLKDFIHRHSPRAQ